MSGSNPVRDIIINGIDEKYHKRKTNEKDPVKILSKLRKINLNEMK